MESFEKRREKLVAVVVNLLYMVFGGSLLGCMIWHHQTLFSWRADVVTGLGICGTVLILAAVCGIITLLLHKPQLIIIYCALVAILVLAIGIMGGACLATDSSHVMQDLVLMWTEASPDTKAAVQINLNCCGFENPNFPSEDVLHLSHPSCSKLPCCVHHSRSSCCSGRAFVTGEPCPCSTCGGILEHHVDRTLKATGFVALATSMMALFGTTWVVVQMLQRYRDQRLEEEQEEDRQTSAAAYERF